MIERLQSHLEDAFWEICDRHLRLLGYPEESYEDLTIKMTPPSDWRELTRTEVVTTRLNNASNLKSSQLMSDFDILTKWMRYDDEEAKKMLGRLKLQKLEDLKLQIISQNPTLLGVGLPGPDEAEVGAAPGGPNPILTPEQPVEGGTPGLPLGIAGMRKYMDEDEAESHEPQKQPPISGSGNVLADPSEEDIKKYDLDIKDYEQEMDDEEIDASEVNE